MSRYLILACLLFSSTQKLLADEPLRVMSFNIRFGTANDGTNHWKHRHPLVLKTINNFSPDLLGTQETLITQAQYLSQNLKEYATFGRSRDKNPNQGEQCTIFFRKDKFQLLESGQFWLSKTPKTIASKSWDSSLPRIASWVRLKHKKSKRELYFLNTHFDHRGKTARLESAKLIAKEIEKFKKPTIVTGDFNCGENSKPYNALAKNKIVKLSDSYRKSHPQPSSGEGTFNGFRGTDTGQRIDWILHTPDFHCRFAGIDKMNDQGKYPSDHFPVTAILMFK
ncbi:MAG: endonuclease/exonuclease/phosphatase family protein [Planctomycetota bacterium]|nr:endonuclease/exonuclease/phosphatase family protein [Planctomycetota bacterium]